MVPTAPSRHALPSTSLDLHEPMTSRNLFLVIALVLSIVIAATYTLLVQQPDSKSSESRLLENPYEIEQNNKVPDVATAEQSTPDASISVPNQSNEQTTYVIQKASSGLYLEPWDVAKTTPSDEEFYSIVEHMRQNPNFLAGVMQEFQSETDPKRLKWLAFMLGELRDKPELTALAGQMLFSGNEQSANSALALLSRLQKHDPAARDYILQSLSTSNKPSVLISSMNALSRAASDASYTQKQQVLQELTPLTQHPQASVRRNSYDLLFRWVSDTPYISQQLILGLNDQNPKVRRSIAIGFIDHPLPSPSVKLALMDMLNNQQELARNRILAARALRKNKLNQDEKRHVDAILKTLR